MKIFLVILRREWAECLSCFSCFSFFFLVVWEVGFHPTQPTDVLSCSEDGTVGMSTFRTGGEPSLAFAPPQPRHFHNVLATKLSVNSFDLAEDLLVYGTDNCCLVFSLVS